MNLAEFAIRQRTFVCFFTVLCIIAGIGSYIGLGKLEDPSFTVKSAVVLTLYPGASAEEVELQVTDKIETRLQEMGSVWKLRSLSRPGSSMIFVDLKENTSSEELPQQWDLLRRKVNDVKLELPMSAQISIVQDEFSEVYGMLFAVYGEDTSPAELKHHAKELQRRLKAVEGIKKVELHGAAQQIVTIDLPSERLAEHKLSSAQIFNQLTTQNMVLDSGSFKLGEERIRVTQSGTFSSVSDIQNFLLKSGVADLGSGLIRLGDIADVYLDYQTPALSQSRFNGKPAITVAVSPVNGINVVELGDALKQVLSDYTNELPVGTEIGTIAFQPDEVQKSINNFVTNLVESIVIVVAVLWIFMGLRSAAIVGSSLLITLLVTLIYMLIAGIDLQRVSVGSFILALGMLVDNAIVITDMFKSKLAQGMERYQAATSSVKETSVPLLAATVIAIMGATPVLLSQTDAAEFSISVFQILCSSLLLSWLVAMTLTPLMCWAFIKNKPGQEGQDEPKISKLSRRALSWVVAKPVSAIALVIPALLVTALVVPKIAINFMPGSDRPILFLDYWLPNGGQTEVVSRDMQKIEQWLLQQPEVTGISSYIGASAPRFSVTVEPEPFDSSYGQILINARDFDSIQALVERGDRWLLTQFPNAEPRFRDLKLATKDKFALEARFKGPDPQVLQGLSGEAQAIFAAHPNTKYVRDDWRQTSKQLVPITNQDKMRRAGINRSDIAIAIQRASSGVVVGALRQGDETLPIKLQSTNTDIAQLENLPVRSLLGLHSVPLSQVVDGFEMREEQSLIWRRNRVPIITAQAAVFGETPSDVRKDLAEQILAIELPYGYSFEWGGEYYDEQRALNDTLKQIPKAVLMMVIIMVALFNGLKQPAIILITLPLASIGCAWTLFLFDKPFGFMGLTGAVALSGMIIKNGIVLIDQIELERKQGRSIGDAIIEATLNRTMAISMGALTTALGMVPLLSDRLFDQMAAIIIGGLVVATFLSLIIMPAWYRIFYREEPQTQAQLEAKPCSELNHENN
ncbi:efflux RND transporter permease subunit [Agarivorans sp. 1_MG-2023]|uniref:efflux RND transporter permease subunit n=1 Tax=Agarivorans sp. 1_MG-2023 TaxID=3062634 RepID=UPI0026E264EB|nr:efflux RND transporter permease subunit [Agarivorans sp. 1_MG-2023]MDO6762592.1 efflux RND transporter permease subunit [Agarivorans sp. 1_MG-2023]